MIQIYIVGTKPCLVHESCSEQDIELPRLPWYYRDIAIDEGWVLVPESTPNPLEATKFDTLAEAIEWNQVVLHGTGVVYRL